MSGFASLSSIKNIEFKDCHVGQVQKIILQQGTDVGLNDDPIDGSIPLAGRFVTNGPGSNRFPSNVVLCKAGDYPLGFIIYDVPLVGGTVANTANNIQMKRLDQTFEATLNRLTAQQITDLGTNTNVPIYVTDQGLLSFVIPDNTAGAVNWIVGHTIGGKFTNTNGGFDFVNVKIYGDPKEKIGTVVLK